MNVEQVEMTENELPKYDMNDNPTGCCPRFHPQAWHGRDLRFRDKLFVKAKTWSIMFVPMNIGKVFPQTFEAIENAEARDPEQCIVMSRDLSPWSAEHLFSVTKDVPNQEMVRVSGNYRTKVFEGPYKDAPKWHKELLQMDNANGVEQPKLFLFYTTCPKCAKVYGKNYVVGLVSKDHTAST